MPQSESKCEFEFECEFGLELEWEFEGRRGGWEREVWVRRAAW